MSKKSNSIQYKLSDDGNEKVDFVSEEFRTYDLEERTFRFANNIRTFVKKLPRSIANMKDIGQLVHASGSVGANYIEANEAISKKDFIFRIKICRKESKESRYWLRLLDVVENPELEKERGVHIQEAKELLLIFAAILRKSENKV